MRVLVTGGSGFVGSHVAEALASDGHHVLVVDNLATGRRENLVDFNGRFAQMSLADAIQNREIGNFQPEAVFHAAASYKNPLDWVADAQTNTVETAMLAADVLSIGGVQRLVYLQTSLCYGRSSAMHGEDDPLKPHGSYAVTKVAGEALLLQSGLDVVSFRLANLYGPRNLSGPVPAFYKRMKAGEPCTIVQGARRDLVYIGDVVPLLVQAVLGEGRAGVYHVSTGFDFEIAHLYEQMRLVMRDKRPPEFVPPGDDDSASILLSTTKTRNEFGWQATTLLGDGLLETVEWYEQNPPGDVYTHLGSVKS